MIEKQANGEPSAGRFDPVKAIDAYGETRKLEIQRDDIQATLSQPIGKILSKKTFTLFVGGVPRYLTIQQHMAELECDIDSNWEGFQEAGGDSALQAYIEGSQGVPYAGEPSGHPRRPPADFVPFDTLP